MTAGQSAAVPAIAESASVATARPTPFYATAFEQHPDARALTDMGRALFFDTALSGSGRMSCASCHDPSHDFGPPNKLAVQLGGVDMKQAGLRAVPSLMYQQTTPPFNEHFSDTDGNDSVDQGPTGGRGWDGRASSAHEQAEIPLLSAFEMANSDRHSVVIRLRQSANAGALRETFGKHVLDDESLAWNALVLALEVFQQSPADFYPYSSKYDAWLRRRAALDARELRGLALFSDPAKGNCAQCHISTIKQGAFPQFTDYGLIAIGVPRNAQIPANANGAYHDLGLCGPLRNDLLDRPEYCGLFKTPTLRNVTKRQSFFHNGIYHRLEDVLDFYARRDTDPARFYPKDSRGTLKKFNDLPSDFHANVNVEAPFDRHPGDQPALNVQERADIIEFLKTLDDGYDPH